MSNNQRVLIVDDTPSNLKVLNEILRPFYGVSVATNGKDALDIARSKNKPDLILLDIMMPEMDGYEVCRRLKSDKATKDIPVLFVTARHEVEGEALGLDMGAVDYITKPINPRIVQARVQNHMNLKMHQDRLEELVRQRTHKLNLTQDVTIETLAALAEYRDPETGGHIRRTKNYVRLLAIALQGKQKYAGMLDDEFIQLLHKSAPLHDVGKVGVKDKILLKPGKLTPEEFEEMKQHTTYGRNTIEVAENKLGEDSFLHLAREIAYTHHEKWDGTGYPQQLKGEDIPISGRLMAVADVYDALISRRVYKPPMPHKKAVGIIAEGKGNHFDPDMVDAFLLIADQFREVALEYADYEEEREGLRK